MASSSATTGRKSFPKNADEFLQDERITYSREDDRYLLVDEANKEWEWNSRTEKWFLPVSIAGLCIATGPIDKLLDIRDILGQV